MSRPMGSKNRIRVATSTPLVSGDEVQVSGVAAIIESTPADIAEEEYAPSDEPVPPSFWGRGALLNVRTTGGDYIVTLYPEEYDARSPERAMRFANPALCQNFVSAWYSRQSHDPRAR